jgi:hypothetical protein
VRRRRAWLYGANWTMDRRTADEGGGKTARAAAAPVDARRGSAAFVSSSLHTPRVAVRDHRAIAAAPAPVALEDKALRGRS